MDENTVRRIIRDELAWLLKSDRLTFIKTLQIMDGRNIQLGTTTGTKIGTAINQKLGFFGATPVDKPETLSDPSGGGTQDEVCRTTVGGLIDRLQELGLMK